MTSWQTSQYYCLFMYQRHTYIGCSWQLITGLRCCQPHGNPCDVVQFSLTLNSHTCTCIQSLHDVGLCCDSRFQSDSKYHLKWRHTQLFLTFHASTKAWSNLVRQTRNVSCFLEVQADSSCQTFCLTFCCNYNSISLHSVHSNFNLSLCSKCLHQIEISLETLFISKLSYHKTIW